MENIGSIAITGFMALAGIGIFLAPPKFMLSWDRCTGYRIYKRVLNSSNDKAKAIKSAGIFYKIFGTCLFLLGLMFLLISLLVHLTKTEEPTLVEDLTANRISPEDVISIKFTRELPGGYEVHIVTSRAKISEQMLDLASRLKADGYRGDRFHNHPSTLIPEQRVEILLKDGSKHKFYGNICHNWDGEDYYYASIDVWPRILPPANSKEASLRRFWGDGHPIHYESRELVAFFQKYSPFLPNEIAKIRPNKKDSLTPPPSGKKSRVTGAY